LVEGCRTIGYEYVAPKSEIAKAVWEYTTRKLTSLSDPDDIVKFLGKGTGTEVPDDKSLYDLIALDRWDTRLTEGRAARIDKIVTLEEVSVGTLTADGLEQTVAELTVLGTLEGYIDLANMQAGDTVIIREYVRLKSGGTYRLYASSTYSDAQSEPALHVVKLPTKYGVRVTLQQTAGVNRTYDYNFFREVIA